MKTVEMLKRFRIVTLTMELLAPFDKLSVVDRNGDVDGKHSETPLCHISFWGARGDFGHGSKKKV